MHNEVSVFFFLVRLTFVVIPPLATAIYRTPVKVKSHVAIFLHQLDKLLYYLSNKFKKSNVIVCGDWNIDILDSTSQTRDLITVLHNYNLEPHIRVSTRGTSCLDQIASNIKTVTAQIHNLYLSDHETAQSITFQIKADIKKHISWFEYKRDFNKVNIQKFCECISSLSFADVYNSEQLDVAFNEFHDIFCLIYNLCFPTIRVKRNNRPTNTKWLTKGLKKAIKTKRKLFVVYKNQAKSKNKNRLHLTNYKKILRKCMLTAKRINNMKFIRNSKSKCIATWKTISSTLTNPISHSDINMIKFNNLTTSDPQIISNNFNSYFINLTSTNNEDILLNPIDIPINNFTIYLKPVSEKETYNIIMGLRNSKASGYDDVVTHIIKSCASYISKPMTYIINLSFLEGSFPEKLKISVVKPLHKKGDKTDPNNYRPISILSVFSKVFEKAMLARLNNFLEKYRILNNSQFGFRKNSSTSLACFHLVKYITESINEKTPIVSIFLDMSKAFDFVNHKLLLTKLEKYGIRGQALLWLESYLIGRMQCVEIVKLTDQNRNILTKTCVKSQLLNICSGVPQGSVLGPLLFLLYINDLPNATPHKCLLFADDTTLLIKSNNKETFQTDINGAIDNVITWLTKNQLHINVDKTKIMQFLSYQTTPLTLKVTYNNIPISEVDDYKFLGLTLDKNLNWKMHIDSLCKRIDRFVFALRRLRQTVSTEAATTAYYGYVASLLSYGIILWGNSVEINRVFLLQKKCLRAIANAKFLDSCKPLFKKFKILPLPCMYIKEICMFVKCNQHLFQLRRNVTNRHIRAQYFDLLYQPPCKTFIYRKNVYNLCIEIYNNLPADLKSLKVHVFKSQLTNWLLDRCFYNLHEFFTFKS